MIHIARPVTPAPTSVPLKLASGAKERVHRAPAEPPERPQQQRRVYLRLELLVQAALEGDVHQVEEVQVTEPDDAEHDVTPPQEQGDHWFTEQSVHAALHTTCAPARKARRS